MTTTSKCFSNVNRVPVTLVVTEDVYFVAREFVNYFRALYIYIKEKQKKSSYSPVKTLKKNNKKKILFNIKENNCCLSYSHDDTHTHTMCMRNDCT